MKVYTEILPGIKIEKLKDIDGIIIPIEGISQGFEKYLDFKMTQTLIQEAKKLGKEVYLMMNSYIIQSELERQVHYLEENIDKVDGIYFQDYSLFQAAKELGKENKMIFCEQAVLTNKFEIKSYLDIGIKNCVISPSLSYNEVKECLSEIPELLVKVYGHALLSYSQRDFISNYAKKYDYKLDSDKTYYLREATREDRLIVRQEDKGTMIYEEKIMDGGMLVKEGKQFIIGAAFLDENQLYQAIEYITGIIRGTREPNELTNGFYNKQSVVRK